MCPPSSRAVRVQERYNIRPCCDVRQVKVTGLEESRLMENLQKIANRISAGVISAALILASALMMRIETGARLFG